MVKYALKIFLSGLRGSSINFLGRNSVLRGSFEQYAPHAVLSKLNYSLAEEYVYINVVLQCGMNDSVHFHVCSCMGIFLSVCDSRS